MTRLSESYNRMRSRTSNIGIIVIGIVVSLVSFFIRSDIFEAILDVVGLIGIIAGLTATGAGIYMLGDEKGWWDRLRSRRQGRASCKADRESCAVPAYAGLSHAALAEHKVRGREGHHGDRTRHGDARRKGREHSRGAGHAGS